MAETYWKNGETWCCSGHFPHAVHHRLSPRCSYTNCKSIRPRMDKCPSYDNQIPELKIVKEEVYLCSWFKCSRGEKGTHAHQRKTSKYCSLQCKNDNARHRYKIRNKLKKTA